MKVEASRRVLGLGAAVITLGLFSNQAAGQPAAPPGDAPPPAAAPVAAVAPQPLRGTITAQADQAPQAGASVSIAAIGALVFSDAAGVYTLSVPPGTHVVRVEMPGYAPLEQTVIVGAEPAVLDFTLAEDQRGEVITIVGARTPRSRLETPVPVDVINSDVITESSHTEMNQILNTVAPSFNASRLSIADGTDHIDPADLRGLGPEHVLVLINGKRLHQSSLINVYSGGTVGVDLNAIPTNAIARIEVLRDGAASQYGSDAIAGVINIVLKDTVDSTQLYSLTGVTGSNDGTQFKLGGNTGFKLGNRGFVNVTGEFFTRGRTNRSKPWSGDIFPGIEGAAATDAELARRNLTREAFTMDVGQSGAYVGTAFLNAGYKLNQTFELHAHGGYTLREGSASGYFRLPNDDNEHRIDLRIYPNGFLPEINPTMNSWNGTVGIRGKHGPWDGDLSLTYGGDRFHFFIDHSLNASLGLASPTHFDAGALNFHQTSVNFDGVRKIDPPVLASLSLVGGAELRRETYAIDAGDPASYELGPELDTAGQPKAPGSQVFPGFRPTDASSNRRLSEAAYAGVESQPTARTNVDLGARFEHYSDFGNTVTGKIAARAALVKTGDNELAVRGSASTGFRAPGLQQLWYSTIASQFVTRPDGPPTPASILISPNRSAVTEAFGVPHLKEETSVNLSAGTTAHLGNLSLSADYYHVKINDRVVLSGKFGTDDAVLGPSVADIVSPFPGVAAAQFFINAVDTSTNGVDLVADYSQRLTKGSLKLTAAANFTSTSVDRVNVPASMLQRFGDIEGGAAQVRQIFLGRYGRNRFEDLLPRQKGTLGARWDNSGWSAGVRANAFGRTEYHSDSGAELDESYAPRVTFDVDFGFRIAGLWWSVGANNVLNTFPAQNKREGNTNNGAFVYSPADVSAGAPYGTDGGFYYARAEYRF
jgi:iron complex outermembrane recepter protein